MKTFSFKLYNSKRNRHLYKIANISGIIYNYCIAFHKRYYKLYGKSLSANTLKKHITKVKKQCGKDYWNLVGSQAIQDIVERIDRSYHLFFENLKRKVRTSPPGFKKVKKYKSFTLKQAGYKFLEDNKVKIGDKVYKYFKSRNIEGNIKTVTVKRNPLGEITIFVVTDYEEQAVTTVKTGKMAGCDFGLKTFITLNDGDNTIEIESPRFYESSVKAVKYAGRKLSRKVKGSNNRIRAKAAYCRAHEKIANQRKDHHFKLARELCSKYDVISFEDLNMKAMQMMWGRKISDLAFSSFLKILEHQATKYGTKIVTIGRFFPSSKTCSDCGHVLEELGMNERIWTCPACGKTHKRDENAAINIRRVGASTLGVETVNLDIAS